MTSLINNCKVFITVSLLLLLTGCASVQVSSVDSADYMSQRRGDVISGGTLSPHTANLVSASGLTVDECFNTVDQCIRAVEENEVLNEEKRLAALSEIWLYKALKEDTTKKLSLSEDIGTVERGRILDAYLQAARSAYAFLFYSERTLASRSLEDRQTQVRDYYNYAVQNAIEILAKFYRHQWMKDGWVLVEGWTIGTTETKEAVQAKLHKLDENMQSIVPDTTLNFDGIHSQHIRDGLGSRMVISMVDNDAKVKGQDWRQMAYKPLSALIRFEGDSLYQVKKNKQATIVLVDPYLQDTIQIGKNKVPVTANFSSAYGLWLANSDFSSQSIATVFGKGNMIEEPTVFLMQPYDPKKKIIILIHGLASSPEAWVNTANEITGDDHLRQNYQIWQIYYPTSVPVLVNRMEIAKAVKSTLDHFDPKRQHPATKDIVLIGHSMGGILSRLLVSSSGDILWKAVSALRERTPQETAELKTKLKDLVFFEPLPGVHRAIFLAAPHQGTPFADKSIAKWLATFVKLPVTIVGKFADLTLMVFGENDAKNHPSMTGIDNLSAQDPTIRKLKELKISPKVTYHSVIGVEDMSLPREEYSDGIVPYWSSHLDGAESEKLIKSGHSVQETPQAIIEIRRILHEHLNTAKK